MPSVQEMVAALQGGPPPVMSDAAPDPVLPWQQYAGPKGPYNPMQGFNPIIPDPNALVGSVAGPVVAGKTWTPQTVDMLKALRAKNTPVKDIANELGVTKGAVAGKLDRLGLTDPTNLGGDRRSPAAALRESLPRQEPSLPKLNLPPVKAEPPPALENALTQYAQGMLTAPDVQRVFKHHGWSVNLRGKGYHIEAFDPTGKSHYLNP